MARLAGGPQNFMFLLLSASPLFCWAQGNTQSSASSSPASTKSSFLNFFSQYPTKKIWKRCLYDEETDSYQEETFSLAKPLEEKSMQEIQVIISKLFESNENCSDWSWKLSRTYNLKLGRESEEGQDIEMSEIATRVLINNVGDSSQIEKIQESIDRLNNVQYCGHSDWNLHSDFEIISEKDRSDCFGNSNRYDYQLTAPWFYDALSELPPLKNTSTEKLRFNFPNANEFRFSKDKISFGPDEED